MSFFGYKGNGGLCPRQKEYQIMDVFRPFGKSCAEGPPSPIGKLGGLTQLLLHPLLCHGLLRVCRPFIFYGNGHPADRCAGTGQNTQVA